MSKVQQEKYQLDALEKSEFEVVTNLSFIIPHKGRTGLLKQTVESIQNLEIDNNSQLEIIVVTQEDSTTVSSALSNSSWVHPIKVLQQSDQLTISALRNYGVRESSGMHLVFLDADIELSSNWLVNLKLDYGAGGRVIVSAMQAVSSDARALEKLRVVLSNKVVDSDVHFLPGRNLMMSRADFQKIGGFPEYLETCEDYYFTDQARAYGTLFYSGSATYIHLGEDKSYGELFVKEIWRGKSNIRSMIGRSIGMNEVPSFLVPWMVLVGLLLAITGLLAWNINVGLVGLVLLVPFFGYILKLRFLGQEKISSLDILKFYVVYFLARSIGMAHGLFALIFKRHTLKKPGKKASEQ